MNILVTGGAGFIGRYLVEQLLNNNQITIYDDLSNSSIEGISFLIKKGAKFVRGDILDFEKLLENGKNFDVVIHLAAKSDVAEAFECAILSDHNGTYNIASGKSISVNELAEMIMLSSGKKLDIIHKEQKKAT